ncbi:XRE family transcriptional regulator [Alistipes sp. Z76]|nr:XRE family transcriptional regulator [Alistipes sp. Z76]
MSSPRIDIQFNKQIAQKLKTLRNERGLSQMRVTMDTGINVSRAESGIRSLSVYSIAVLCKYYGISLSEFFIDLELTAVSW